MRTRKMTTVIWVLAGLLGACGALRAAEPEKAYTAGDTIRLSWEVNSGEEKSFTFTGTADAAFVVEWGDGVRSRLKGRGEEPITARHTYRIGKQYNVHFYGLPEREEVAWEGFTETAGGMEMPMVQVIGGSFQMGCTDEQYGQCSADESPVHTVILDSYYIGMYEVTQAQWKAVMGPLNLLDSLDLCYGCPIPGHYVEGDDYPMYNVTWKAANDFCAKLSQMTGKTYRLPTEAEWEYAARGGHRPDGTRYSGSNNVKEVSMYYNCYQSLPVGRMKPNGLGLYNMSGNVWEWCSDWYDKDYYSISPERNPQGPVTGDAYVKRGGSGNSLCTQSTGHTHRVSARFYERSDRKLFTDMGFRVVCEQ